MNETSAKTLADEVAYAMETSKAMLPHLPYLLQDLPSLSGSEDDVVAALKEAGLPQGASVLDLGCGRGDIAIKVARAFEAKVLGVDGHQDFVEIARQAAMDAGLDGQCRFVCDDLRSQLVGAADYDAVLMIALGPVLGDYAATMGLLRSVAKEGGLIVIDDAFLDMADAPSEAYEDYLGQEETEAGLQSHGDVIIVRQIRSPKLARFNDKLLEMLPIRARELALKHPELDGEIKAYVERQFEEVAFMDDQIVPALWVLRKPAS